jgi:NDP-sugar pyrophosphorylase family protein
VKETPVPVNMGVFEFSHDGVVTDVKEKPTLTYSANMGVYCMDPSILDLIPRGVPYGFDDLRADAKAGSDQGNPLFQSHLYPEICPSSGLGGPFWGLVLTV